MHEDRNVLKPRFLHCLMAILMMFLQSGQFARSSLNTSTLLCVVALLSDFPCEAISYRWILVLQFLGQSKVISITFSLKILSTKQSPRNQSD